MAQDHTGRASLSVFPFEAQRIGQQRFSVGNVRGGD
jgi:hypothetical protein